MYVRDNGNDVKDRAKAFQFTLTSSVCCENDKLARGLF